LLLLAVAALLMPLAAGHSSSDTNHDIATEAIAVHVPVVAVWLGVLVCLLRRAAGGADITSAATRYRRFAAVCWFVVAGPGLVDAAVLAPGNWEPNSTYVVVLAFKVAIMAAAGVFGMRGRKRALPGLNRVGGGGLRQLLGLELVLLLAATGLAAALTQLFPPGFARPVTIPQTRLAGQSAPVDEVGGPLGYVGLTALRLLMARGPATRSQVRYRRVSNSAGSDLGTFRGLPHGRLSAVSPSWASW
jgi:putative copper resistance protein D